MSSDTHMDTFNISPEDIERDNHKFKECMVDFPHNYQKDNSLLNICNYELGQIEMNMREKNKKIHHHKLFQENIKKYLNGECSNIMVLIRTEPDVSLPISIIPEKELYNLYGHKIISKELLNEELDKRAFLKSYPTEEDKRKLIEELTISINLLKEEVKTLLGEYHLCLMKKHLIQINISRYEYYSKYLLAINEHNKTEQDIPLNMDESSSATDTATDIATDTATDTATNTDASSSVSFALSKSLSVIEEEDTEEEDTEGNDDALASASASATLSLSASASSSVSATLDESIHDKHHKTSIIGDDSKRIIKYQLASNLPEDTSSHKKEPLSDEMLKRNISSVNIKLEKMCKYGSKCHHKHIPLYCSHNHRNIGNSLGFIEKGSVIPDSFCPNEKLWKFERCRDINCCLEHAYGRVGFIMSIKKEEYERKRKYEHELEQEYEHNPLDLRYTLDNYKRAKRN